MKRNRKAPLPTDQVIRLHSAHPDGTAFDCRVLAQNSALLVIQELTDFEPDGIVVLPTRWIKGYTQSKAQKCTDAVVQHEKTLRPIPRRLDFTAIADLPELIERLRQADIWPAVEVVFKDDGVVYLGRITKVSASGFQMRSYSAEGKWLRGESEFNYDEVFKIEIESRYTRHFNHYMRSRT